MHQRPKAPLAARWMNENEMPFTVPLFCEKRKWIGLCLLVFSFLVSLSYVHSSYHQLSTCFIHILSLALFLLCLIFFFCVVCVFVRTSHPSMMIFFLLYLYVRSCCWCCKTPYPFLRTELLTRLKTNRPTMGLAFVPPDSLFFNCSRSCCSDYGWSVLPTDWWPQKC